jgi:hypothetical protein
MDVVAVDCRHLLLLEKCVFLSAPHTPARCALLATGRRRAFSRAWSRDIWPSG